MVRFASPAGLREIEVLELRYVNAAGRQPRILSAGGGPSPACGQGKNIVVPVPGADSAQICPPWRSMIRRTLARPIPEPSKPLVPVKLLEGLEEVRRVLHVEAHAVVGDVEQVLLAMQAAANPMNAGWLSRENFQALPSRFSRVFADQGSRRRRRRDPYPRGCGPAAPDRDRRGRRGSPGRWPRRRWIRCSSGGSRRWRA